MTETQAELKRYKRVLEITIAIFTTELLGAIISGSMTLLADSFHVFIDGGATIVSLVVARAVLNGYNEKAVRSIGGKINASFLVVVGLWMIFEAISQMKDHHVASGVMLFFSVLTGVGNLWQHRALNSGGRCQHITHKSMNAHVISDFLMSIGVVVTGIAIQVTGQPAIDTYVSMAIALIITVWGILIYSEADNIKLSP